MDFSICVRTGLQPRTQRRLIIVVIVLVVVTVTAMTSYSPAEIATLALVGIQVARAVFSALPEDEAP